MPPKYFLLFMPDILLFLGHFQELLKFLDRVSKVTFSCRLLCNPIKLTDDDSIAVPFTLDLDESLLIEFHVRPP